MILDKLMEKKDLILYINFRIYRLKHEFDVTKYPEKKRDHYVSRLNGRIRELEKLKDVIQRDELKIASKRLYKSVVKLGYDKDFPNPKTGK
jgi:hypothetical protein